MKNNILICLSIVLCCICLSCKKKSDDTGTNNNGQPSYPTLTSSTNAPAPGDVYYLHTSQHNTMLNVGAGGTDAVWDFSTLSDDSKDTITYIAVAATYYASLFPSSTVAEKYGDSAFNYYRSDASGFSYLGQKNKSTLAFQYIYCDPEIATPLPLTYNTRYCDTAAYGVGSGGCVNSYTDSIVCDGVGTLKLPTGTFTNVLRIHKFGTDLMGQTKDRGYEWYVSGHHMPLLKIDNGPNGKVGGSAAYTTK